MSETRLRLCELLIVWHFVQMVEGLKSACAPHALHVGLVYVAVWNQSVQARSSPPWSISLLLHLQTEQWIISVYTIPIKGSYSQTISWTVLGAGGILIRRSTITRQTKKCQCLEHLVSESVRWLLCKLSSQILTTAWKHPHCINTHTDTHPTPNLPSVEIFSLHSHNCCLPCHPCLTQANSKLIRGVLFSTVEVRHGEKKGDVANMRTQEELACVVWFAEEKSICAHPGQRVLKNNSHPIWNTEGIITWDQHEAQCVTAWEQERQREISPWADCSVEIILTIIFLDKSEEAAGKRVQVRQTLSDSAVRIHWLRPQH